MKRRLLASLLTLVMMLNLLPTVAWARNDEGIDADSVEMYSSDDVVTSGPITLWTGKEGQITVPEENEVRSSNADIVSVEQDGTAVTLTGGSKEGRAEVTAGESTWVVYNYASEAEYNYLYSLFHGKTISVMGDSISTIKDKIPSGNALYYDNTTGKEMTFERNYWGDIITRFGAVEGIDEAWSGSTIGSKAASMASKDRINKLDDNGTPDVILYYGGSNPDSSVGTFNPDADYAKTVDWAKSYSDTASAYAASLQRMKETYPDAEIIAIIPYYEQNNIPKQAEVIEQIAKHYDITTIDLRELRNQEGISPNNALHPNMDGHSQIAAYICQQLYEQQAVTPNEKTVTYDANGGSFKNGSDPIKQSVTAELPKATRAGYAFVGWFDQAAGGNKVASALDTAIPSGMQDNLNGTTLYAHWTHTFTWNFNSDMNAVDADGNVIITVSAEHGSTTLNDDNTVKFNDYQGELSTPFTLDPTQNWRVEWKEKNQATENMLFSSTAERAKGMTYIFLYQPSIYMGTYNDTTGGTKYINFGGPAYQKTPTSDEYSVVKLENNYDKATETSLVTLSVDGEQVFAKLNTQGRYGSHGSSLTASDYEQYALEKLGFTFNYLGGNRDGGDTPAWKLSNTFDYIKVTLGDDHTHTYGTTYSSDSTGHWKTCTECGANGEFSKHTGGTATCTAKAVCETCDQPYGELGAHKLTKTAAKAATCTEAGNNEYWTCKTCGKYFSDEKGENAIADLAAWKTGDGKINATGHNYGDITYTWSDGNTSCTAKKVCSVCKDEVTETVGTTSSVKTPATCTTKGTKTYTATFSAPNGFVTQTKDVDIAATGHDWSNKDGICAVCHTKCDRVHKPGTTCSVCHKYTSYPYVPGAPTYPASAPAVPNGTVTVSPANASKGANVTVTVKPNEGYVLETLTVTDKNGDELKLTDKGNGKYTFTMPGSKVEVKATFMEDNSVFNFFYDVPNDAFFYEAVKWAVKSGVTNGLTDTMFGPYESCTRAQIVTFLWRAAGSPEPKTASSFTDVPASAYYAKAVAWAIENGITNGMTETTFAPNATCTRGQSVTFLYRALKGTASGSTNFTDVKSDAFYTDAINWAVANNVTNGTSNTTFSPNADCTRAEIVTFLYRAYQGK